jgi:uracil-DNA glycosylase
MKEQIRLVAPSVLIPMGKVAINWFFPWVTRLEEVIGKTYLWEDEGQEYAVICLPHSSPASGWWKAERNQPFLANAIQLLSEMRVASFG